MDGVIGQTDTLFLQDLLEYNKIISQRNALLKFFALNNTFDQATLDIYDDQLIKRSDSVYKKRLTFMKSFVPVFNYHYKKISEGKESISLEYVSQLHEKTHEELLKNSQPKDRILQHTTQGVH